MFGFIRRAVLNSFLEEKSNALKAEYDNLEEELYHEIEMLTCENTRKINVLIGNLNSRLENEQKFLQCISIPLKEYIKLSFEVNLIYEQRNLLFTGRTEIISKKQFLKTDIEQTKLEIEELKTSKAKLLSITDIRPYIELLKCNNICFDTNKNIIEEINELINNKNTLPDERKALLRLEDLIREKMFIRKDINFIDWAIGQKNKKIETNITEKRICDETCIRINGKINALNTRINDLENNKFEIAASINDKIHAKNPDLISTMEKLDKARSKLKKIYDIDEDDRSDDDWEKIRTLMGKKQRRINKINKLYLEHRELIQYKWRAVCDVLNQYNLKFIVRRKGLNNKQGAVNEG